MTIVASAYITPGSGSFQDGQSNTYILTPDNHAEQNSQIIPGGGGTSAMAWANNQVFGQDMGSGTWWIWNGDMNNSNWTPADDTVVPPSSQPPTQSPNGTVVKAGHVGSIVDAAGNVWTINSSAQVAVNGAADTATANVVEIAYVNGAVWQENNANLWWFKNAPSDTWQPGSDPLTPAKPSTWKIMPLGDSMTEGGGTAFMGGPPPGGYRWPLYEILVDLGINFQFVGDQTTNPGVLPTTPVDQTHHEGIGGAAIDLPPGTSLEGTTPMLQYLQANNILTTYQPDIVLLMMGYNNLYSPPPANVGPAQAYQYLVSMVKYITATLPNAKVVVSTEPAANGDLGVPTSDQSSTSELGLFNYSILNSLKNDVGSANVSIIDYNAAEQAVGALAMVGPDNVHPNVPACHLQAVQWSVAVSAIVAQ